MILIKPLITEKATGALGENKYSFIVNRKATKTQIRNEVEKTFGVHVIHIQTVTTAGKKRRLGFSRKYKRTLPQKKAIVQLKKEEKINIFETGE